MRASRVALPGLIASLALLATACSSGAATPSSPPEGSAADAPLAIATTTHWGSILSDISQCAGTTSATLMGPGDDPHEFSTSSAEVANLVKAKLVITNGLGLEGGLRTTLANAAKDGAHLVEMAPQLDPIPFGSAQHSDAAEHGGSAEPHSDHAGHDHGTTDPHVHMDAGRMAKGAALVGSALADATGNSTFTTCGAQVEQQLRDTDAEVRQILSVIPQERRVLLTDHEAYNYFAQAYGFTVAGVVIPGGGTDAEPSSAELAALVDVVHRTGVRAIFSNNTVNPRLVDAVAREAGTPLAVVELYEGSVGPAGSGADTYRGMMLTDAQRIADALA